MPFVIKKGGSCPTSKPWGVYTETAPGSGKTRGYPHGCHESQTKALAQQRALYANVPDARSAAPAPPNLRDADAAEKCCGTCKMFNHETHQCWGYGNWDVSPNQVCDSFAPEPDAEEANSEVSMSTTVSPPAAPRSEWRRDRALALSESQRKRTENRQSHEPLELREGTEDGKRVLRSYASLFDTPYGVRAAGYKFDEVVRPGAFKRTLGTNPDVVFRTEHSGPPLAATWSGDLRLGEDEKGLWYEVDLDESDPDVKSLISKVQRGVYRESSFAFRVPKDGDRWNEEHDEREVLACELDRGDVSVVTFGASRATGEHMVLRSEALEEIGRQQFIAAWKEYREWLDLSPEERIGKVVSSQTAETLRKVLGLVADADNAIDEAESMLADFLGVPNPDKDADSDDPVKSGSSPTDAEQLDRVRSEERGKTESDLDSDHNRTAPHLSDTVLVHLAHAVQHCECLFDPEVQKSLDSTQFNSEHLQTHLLGAQEHAQKLDNHLQEFASDPSVFRSERERLTAQRDEERSEPEDLDLYDESEERKALTTKARNNLPATAFVFPKERRYPIHDIAHARNALARASGKPEEAKVKAAVYRRYPALRPSNRAELLPNDTEDLLIALKLRG